MNVWRSFAARLVVTHLIVGVMGAAAGAAYVTKVGTSTRDVLHTLRRSPLLDAANVAFHYGSLEHSRATLESLLRIPPTNEAEWADVMMAELRLAVVTRELASEGKPSPHLDAAVRACRRLGRSDCTAEKLRSLAVKLAHD